MRRQIILPGEEMFRIGVAEIPAIEELTRTRKTKVFAKSLATNPGTPSSDDLCVRGCSISIQRRPF